MSSSCPNINRCPLFPRFTEAQPLRVLKALYCEGGSHERCERYISISKGVPPPLDLLPDGKSFTALRRRR